MALECLQGFLWFVAMALQEQKQSLVIKKFLIIVDLVFVDVLEELIDLLTLIFIMLDLTIIKEAGALLALLSFFLFFQIKRIVLFGKQRYAFQWRESGPQVDQIDSITKVKLNIQIKLKGAKRFIFSYFQNIKYLIQKQNQLDNYIFLQRQMEANGINYYKGVLLCSRPNESPSISQKKQFCGRVYAHEQVGLVPVKEYDQHKTKKRVLPVLNNHKKWLEKFKSELQLKRQQEEKQKQKQLHRLEKIKQQGYEEREKQKQSTFEPNNNKQEQKQTATKKQEPNLKKKEKPAWAKTALQAQKTEDKQVDQLIDFFNQQKATELQDYVSDSDVKSILIDLKTKIQKLKQQEGWRKTQLKKMEEDRKKQKQQKQKDKDDDILSRISKQSGGQSISSHKTAQRIQQLQKKKKQNAEWDKLTAGQKKTMASVDEQIAKNIADEVLRNYPNLKHHSNQSIRQLLQKQAHQQIKS